MSYMRPIKNTGQNCTNVFEIKIKSLKRLALTVVIASLFYVSDNFGEQKKD